MARVRLVAACLLSALVALPATAAHESSGPGGAFAPADEPAAQLAKRKARGARKKSRKSAAEARRKAEEEARRKAEEEAKKAEEEAEKARLAEEAKKAAEEQARLEEQRKQEEAERAAREAEARAKEAAEKAATAQGLDARVRRLTDSVARALKRLPGDVRDQTFAVLPFVENGEETKARQLGLVVSDMVMTNLARDHRLTLTERSQLRQVFQEQELSALGAVDEKHAVEVGKLAGARALVVGEISDTGDSFRLAARVLDAETAAVLAADDVTLPKEELIALSADAVVLKSRSGAAFRSLVAPGWGQLYNQEPVKAGIVGGAVGVLALATGVTLTSAAATHIAYDNWHPDQLKGVASTQENVSSTVIGLRNAANAQYTAAAILGGITAAAWLGGALEAYLSGTDVESLDEALAKN